MAIVFENDFVNVTPSLGKVVFTRINALGMAAEILYKFVCGRKITALGLKYVVP